MVEPPRKLGHCNHVAFIFPYLDYINNNAKNEVLVHEEVSKGCDPRRIAVGGYNEDFEVALLAVLANDIKIGGNWGIAESWEVASCVEKNRQSTNASTPVSVMERSTSPLGEGVLKRFGHPV